MESKNAPEVLRTVALEEGTVLILTEGTRGFHVTLRDSEAEASVYTLIFKTREQAEAKMAATTSPSSSPGFEVVRKARS